MVCFSHLRPSSRACGAVSSTRFQARRIKSILTLLLILAPLSLMAQGGVEVYCGRVLDKATGRPLPYASVSLSGSAISNVTNAEGDFNLKVAAGEGEGRSIIISHLGYRLLAVRTSQFNTGEGGERLTRFVVEESTIQPTFGNGIPEVVLLRIPPE